MYALINGEWVELPDGSALPACTSAIVEFSKALGWIWIVEWSSAGRASTREEAKAAAEDSLGRSRCATMKHC